MAVNVMKTITNLHAKQEKIGERVGKLEEKIKDKVDREEIGQLKEDLKEIKEDSQRARKENTGNYINQS